MGIKQLSHEETGDFKQLIDIFKTVFEVDSEMPDDQHLSALLANPYFLAFVVKINDAVVGGLTIYILNRYFSAKPIAYIYDVGIAPDHQGKGLGQALLAEVCRFCQVNGFEEAYVEAEDDDIDAVNFYRKTKFSDELVARHFTYSWADTE
jgi:aminoglycoside 3-N-acetyltransferase I